jgi:hypothetical protein
MISDDKRYVIAGNKVKYVCKFLRKYIEYDNKTTNLAVTMENSYNQPCVSNTKIEEYDVDDFFMNEHDAQMEIIRRERFEKK